jgi:hypothetical protein
VAPAVHPEWTVLYDGGPTLRAHTVHSLDDRVRILRRLVWLGDRAFGRGRNPIGGLQDPRMRQIGLAVTQGCRARNDMCELAAIFQFVQENVRYTGDIVNKDTFATAYRTLQLGGEDCDGHAVLNSVLAGENGFQTKFRITSNTGATWDHIFCMAGVPKHSPTRWIALDTTLPGANKFGVQPPMAKYKDFEVSEP